MSFDRDRLIQLTQAHGPVISVVVAEVAGSAPREVGAAMVVWADGQDGTIGGGALEFAAAAQARAMLAEGRMAHLARMALGPALNQCCGGAVTLLSELWTSDGLTALDGPIVARPLPGNSAEMPLAVHRALARARGQGAHPSPRVLQGWFIEPVTRPSRDLWIWGAGHVGRALVQVLAPLPRFRITWADVGEGRFPPDVPANVAVVVAENPADLVALAPRDAEHLVLTFSHALDLELCHRLLGHGFGTLGLIGSATKWARFRARLSALGHARDRIETITCPIGIPALGKHPHEIALGVAVRLLDKTCDNAGSTARDDDQNRGGLWA